MTQTICIPDSREKNFAVHVVHTLRDAGFEAVWAGGCVRDALLGLPPKDFDVATSARPDQVIELFGENRTVPVGVSFGVVMVLGQHRRDGQIEVATFRADGDYGDGRRPDSISFCSAEEDALRRDFTINGMFYDPVSEQVLDYVGGRQDLQRRVIRAIGDPHERIAEDKLRMLRAARFAARLGFELDADTAAAVRAHAEDLTQVSVERISQELRRILSHPTRQAGLQLLDAIGLRPLVFPETSTAAFHTAVRLVPYLNHPVPETSLAVLYLEHLAEENKRGRISDQIRAECRRLKLSNEEADTICWLCESYQRCQAPQQLPLHLLKPILASSRRDLLLDLVEAAVQAGQRPGLDLEFLREYLKRTPQEVLDPASLIGGAELQALEVPRGPEFRRILDQIRREQLDEQLHTPQAALQRARELMAGGEGMGAG